MTNTIRVRTCGCEHGDKCTPTTLCAVESAVRDQREHDEAEIEFLRAEVERLRSVADAEMKLREGNFAEIERLRADAERWQMLLQLVGGNPRGAGSDSWWSVARGNWHAGTVMSSGTLTAAIDAARATAAPERT